MGRTCCHLSGRGGGLWVWHIGYVRIFCFLVSLADPFFLFLFFIITANGSMGKGKGRDMLGNIKANDTNNNCFKEDVL